MLDIILSEEALKRFVAEMQPPSLIMALGTPNLENIFSFKNFSATLWSAALQGTASTHLDT